MFRSYFNKKATLIVFVFLFLFSLSQKANAVPCPLLVGGAYRTASSPGVYYITEVCTKRPIKNPAIFFSYFTDWNDVKITTEALLAQVPNDSLGFMPWGVKKEFKNGSLIKTVDQPRVYLLINKVLFPFANEDVFKSMGQSWGWIEDVSPDVVARFSIGSSITGLENYPAGFVFKYLDSPDVYELINQSNNLNKNKIKNEVDLNLLYRVDRVVTLPANVVFSDAPLEIMPSTPQIPESTPIQPPVTQPIVEPTKSEVHVSPTPLNLVTVTNISELRFALENATYGTTIIMESGTYMLDGKPLTFLRSGTAEHPIIVQARVANSVVINTNQAEEAFYLTQPYYVFDGLSIQVRGEGSYHAFKLNGNAHDVVIKNGKMEVYKGAESAIKGASSGYSGPYPDNLLVENNEIFFNEPTDYVVAEGVDGVGVKGWVIRNNNIHDIKIANTNFVAWGVVLKGNSQDAIIENNTFDNNDLAISIGGTTASQYFRNGETKYEHQRAMVRNNTIKRTKDVAIYLEKAYETKIIGNIITDSSMNGNNSSIDIRYPESTAILQNNTLDKPVRDRDGGTHSGEAPAPAPAVVPTPVQNLTSVPISTTGLSLSAEESGLPGMYGGAWGLGDFDGDRFLDLVVYGHFNTMYHSSENPNGGNDELRLYRNISTTGGAIKFSLQQVVADNNGNRGAMVVVGDFNGDGKPDFAVQTRNGGRGAGFINEGNWKFTRRELPFANDVGTFAMVASDVNKDGKDDLIFAADGGVSAGLWYSFEPATNTWVAHQTDFPHRLNYGATMAAGDLTGDGYPEFVVGGNSSIPFGSHDCTGVTPITSGSKLQYGQANKNLGGSNGFSQNPLAIVSAFGYKVPDTTRRDLNSCHGMDNAQMQIADIDRDGKNDVIIAGSSTGQDGQVGMNGQQYDFAVLFNDGTGSNYYVWENSGPQNTNGGTNGGVGNLDFPGIAIGDINGDSLPDIFVEGHRRDFTVLQNPYVYENLLFLNNGNRTFTSVSLSSLLPTFDLSYNLPSVLGFLSGRSRYIAEGGSIIADFNRDGKNDIMFSGAELPYHTNGVNFHDYNNSKSLKTYMFRNTK